ncbi:MAG: hypothetical protein ACFFE4_12360, partial [Candidatus Thorarchaeota archaeon]
MAASAEFQIIQNLILFVLIIGTIAFFLACKRNRRFYSWLIVYFGATFAQMVTNLGFYIESIGGIGNMFQSFVYILIIFNVVREYYRIYYKSKRFSKKTIPILQVAAFSPQILGLLMVFGVLLFICIFLSLRIYLKEKKATQAFFLLTVIAAFLTILSIELWGQGVLPTAEVGVGVHLIFAVIMMVTAFVAFLEQKIQRSQASPINFLVK